MKYIANHEWAQLAERYRNAEPFPSICIDDFLDSNFIDDVIACYPDYDGAKQIGHEFSGLNENKKVQITDPNIFPEAIKSLCEVLASDDFIGKMEKLTGIDNLIWDPSFTGGGMHLTNSSGLLDVHVDFNFEGKLQLYRRVNILIYLNEEWSEDWGGNVELWDKQVKNCTQSFEPKANRCVVFNTSDYSFHGVTAVASPDGKPRKSFAAYYYTKDAGDNAGEVYGGHHTTIFKARPYEYKKRFISMPAQSIKASIKSFKRSIRSALK